ncbi:hypothetical protein DNH61_10065 [Paenibacillus sambharensis]|uniref:Copper chaperone PCu(A)C n=1 Tax=Paenibacillus sambharensis TaxID=1803190 RepID=A0A2W1LMX7_9BACL|nr:hypothetical protein [Paenibacillus sambharensis]PZD95794.1 hypothetical protein DNH61_10065 [Paenibacillus sambharensis]
MRNQRESMSSRRLGIKGILLVLAAAILLAAAATACQPDRTAGYRTAESTRPPSESQREHTPQESAARGIVVELRNQAGRPLAGLSLQYPGGLLALAPIAAGEGIEVTVMPDLEQGGELRLLYRNSADQVKSLALPGLLSRETEGPVRLSIHADDPDGLRLLTVS